MLNNHVASIERHKRPKGSDDGYCILFNFGSVIQYILVATISQRWDRVTKRLNTLLRTPGSEENNEDIAESQLQL
jgi:hypothetical protein